MPTSSLWSQLFLPHPLWRHSVNDVSLPVQRTSSIQIFPFPMPKVADEYTFTANPNPSSRQTTLASVRSHPSSHTVPQVPSWNTSTRPWRIESDPSASRTANKWYKRFCVSVFVYCKGGSPRFSSCNQERMSWESESLCPMIIFLNLFKVRARAAKVIFVCCFRDPRGLLSRERGMFRRQTFEVWQPFNIVISARSRY